MRAEALEDVTFLSGVALSHLHLVAGSDAVPHAIHLDRLVLRAAEACVASSVRVERAGELRSPQTGLAVIADPCHKVPLRQEAAKNCKLHRQLSGALLQRSDLTRSCPFPPVSMRRA
jgi:hypothetical protein